MDDWKDPIHPGEILADELEEVGLNPHELASRIGVPSNRLYQIIKGQRNITADTALRLARFFGTSPEFWLNLQHAYELDVARPELGESLDRIVPWTVDG
jgi:antitoxin HigA-1